MKFSRYTRSKSDFSSLNISKLIAQFIWTLFFFSVFAAQQLNAWPLVKTSGWGGGSSFIDLRSVLHSADCSERIGLDIYDPDKWGDCGYIYGSFLIQVLGWSHLDTESTSQIGWIFILLFSVLCGYVLSTLWNLSHLQRFACVLILVSPGSMLLLERGNFDVLLILLVASAAISLWQGRVILSLVFIAISALFKFYTLPLLFLVVFQLRNRKKIFVGTCVSFLVVLLILKDLILIKGTFPNNVMGSFGNQIPWLYLNYAGIEIPRIYGEIIGYFVLIVAVAVVWILFKGKVSLAVNTIDLRGQFTLSLFLQYLFFCTFLICFFAGVNYDYRIPYLSVPAVLFLGTLRKIKLNLWFVISPLLIATWTSYNVGWLQVIGDCAVLLLTAMLILFSVLFVKRNFHLLLSAISK